MPTPAKSSLRSLARTSEVSTPTASSSASVSFNNAPRGTAMVSSGAKRRLRRALFPRQREVQAVDVQREADGRQVAPEAADEVVVASAAAQRLAECRVEHVEHRAGVVAQAAGQSEVEHDALVDRLGQRCE